jgi:hypothetical protein
MSAATAGLKRLHELHIRLQDINKQLEHGPRQVKARQLKTRKVRARKVKTTAAASKISSRVGYPLCA